MKPTHIQPGDEKKTIRSYHLPEFQVPAADPVGGLQIILQETLSRINLVFSPIL